jgi:hypothetical protein
MKTENDYMIVYICHFINQLKFYPVYGENDIVIKIITIGEHHYCVVYMWEVKYSLFSVSPSYDIEVQSTQAMCWFNK